MTSHGQCARAGGGGACECPRSKSGGVFLGGRMTSRGQCPCECLHPLQEILYPRLYRGSVSVTRLSCFVGWGRIGSR